MSGDRLKEDSSVLVSWYSSSERIGFHSLVPRERCRVSLRGNALG